MPSDLDIEILTIDDSAPPAPVKTVLDKTIKTPMKKKWRTVRKSTGVGGKAPHSAIPFKPLRKSVSVKPPTPRKAKNVNPEYFEVEDDDSDDEIQVIENDPLDEVEVLDDGASEGFCDMCGLYLENSRDMESHHESVHQLVTCKWCQSRLATTEIKNHIGAKLCPNFTKLLGSHCSVHNEIETDDQLELESFKNCRPLRCDACSQRYDRKSLRDFDEKSKTFICPGCLHGRIDASEEAAVQADDVVIELNVSESSANSPKPEKTCRPIPQFLSTPNPIPLPEILLLDDNSDINEVDVTINENVKDMKDDESTEKAEASGEPSTEILAKSKKPSPTITSKLVEMINTEVQEKIVAKDAPVEIPVKDVVEIIETEEQVEEQIEDCSDDEKKQAENVTDEDVVCIETEMQGSAESIKDSIELPEEEVKKSSDIEVIEVSVDAELAKSVTSTSIESNSVDENPPVIEKEIDNPSNPVISRMEKSTNSSENENSSLDLVSPKESTTNPQSSPSRSPVPVKNDNSASPATPNPVSTPARRVARKSTKPPQNPQRVSENISELLLFENLTTDISTPSPKRKLVSPVTSVRKVARKSTRPPINPQRTLFNVETVEEKKKPAADNCNGDVGCINDEMDSSLLLATPEKGYPNVMDELEVLDELVG